MATASTVRVSFYGAAGEVTGSCYLIETGRAKVLVDCGMHQGGREADARNARAFVFDPAQLDAVVLTHAHIDHVGRLPLLGKRGYRKPIYATPATCKLVPIMLEDSAELQENDAIRQSRMNAMRGKPPVEPLYTPKDVPVVLGLLTPIEYQKPKEVAPGVVVRWTEAGHILGSASLEITCTLADGTKKVIVMSGDLGPKGVVLMRDFEAPIGENGRQPDLVICESTYGDHDHRRLEDTVEEFAGILREAMWDKDKVLIPAFAVGRSQTMLYYLNELERSCRCPKFDVYLDSPMGAEATQLYKQFMKDMDGDTRKMIASGEDPLGLDHVHVTKTGEESRALNERRGSMVIIAASGMCTGGRIMHHLRHNLYKRDCRVIIAGYQAVGSLGRRLVDGEDEVRIFGEPIVVRARVHTLGGFSAHAGQSDLMSWMGNYGAKNGKPASRLVLTHGEAQPRMALRDAVEKSLGFQRTFLPEWGASVEV
ncbi:MAG: MBL fold metallo-hydrolase [Phycisphaerales bacterium]